MIDKTDKYTVKKKDIFDLPFRLIICGKSGMGKTSLGIGNFLLRSEFYKDDFEPENIYIFSGSLTENKMQTVIKQLDIPSTNLFDNYDEDSLEMIYDNIVEEYDKDIEDKKIPKQHLIILDDLSYTGLLKQSKINSQLDRLYCNGRKYLISTLTICQKYSQINTTCREQLTGLILGKCSNKQLDLVEQDLNFLDNKKQFYKMVRDNTPTEHDFMVFNMSNDNGKNIYQDKDFETINIQ